MNVAETLVAVPQTKEPLKSGTSTAPPVSR
jgi:hypothetical protein